jgi:predicted unusual protein kinase regulating ubiquinone biosynthesis (AarF/ABC1/UbiB family)
VVTLEDVTAIKITDYERMTAAGIDRRDVARRLIHTYLWMVFNQRFYHADPHPGNLFVYPLPPDATPGSGQHANGQELFGQPFYLIFVDFGMVGRLTTQIEAGMREALIAMTTRDTTRLIQAYRQLGILLPGADTVRIEQASRAAFDRVWGMDLSQISHMHFTEAVELGREFSDLIFSMPFQVPQDFLYLTRCVGILVGLCTGLDPSFNPWHEVAPFAATLLDDGRARAALAGLSPREWLNPETWRALISGENAERLIETAIDLARRSAQLPALADSVLRQADRGDLVVRAAPSPELERQVGRLEHAAHRLAGAVLFAGVAVSSAILYTNDYHTVGLGGLIVSGLLLVRAVFA